MHSFQELKKMSELELKNLLKDGKSEMAKIRLLIKTGQKKASHELKNIKKYVARLMTSIKNYS